MFSESPQAPSTEPRLRVEGVGKTYRLYNQPSDRLWQFFLPKDKSLARDFVALQDVSFTLQPGEVLGIVGVNGAGKSTLLQLVSGTIQPTTGTVERRGRIAAILELGAGFNPEFTGRENIFLNASTLGLTKKEVDERLPAIIDFAGLGHHLDDPVKTYSSGMQVRLAFSIATSVDADILIVDEALSVGDGAFRRKSFDRIMEIRAKGTSILFCSHVLYHLEALCERALWLHQGRLKAAGACKAVLRDYQEHLDTTYDGSVEPAPADISATHETGLALTPQAGLQGDVRIESVEVRVDGVPGTELEAVSMTSSLEVDIHFRSDPALAAPSAALTISTESGKILGSTLSASEHIAFSRTAAGDGVARIKIDHLPFTTGRYRLGVYLFCERGLHGYDMRDPVVHINMKHQGLEVGYLKLAGQWCNPADTV